MPKLYDYADDGGDRFRLSKETKRFCPDWGIYKGEEPDEYIIRTENQIECQKCKNQDMKFNVFKGHYSTTLVCSHCGHAGRIHEG